MNFCLLLSVAFSVFEKYCREISCARLSRDFHHAAFCASSEIRLQKKAAGKLCWKADKSCLDHFHRKLRSRARQSDAWWDTVGQRLAGHQSNKGRDWLDLKDLGKMLMPGRRSSSCVRLVSDAASCRRVMSSPGCDAFSGSSSPHPQGDAALFAQGRMLPKGKVFPNLRDQRAELNSLRRSFCCSVGSIFSRGSDEEKKRNIWQISNLISF